MYLAAVPQLAACRTASTSTTLGLSLRLDREGKMVVDRVSVRGLSWARRSVACCQADLLNALPPVETKCARLYLRVRTPPALAWQAAPNTPPQKVSGAMYAPCPSGTRLDALADRRIEGEDHE